MAKREKKKADEFAPETVRRKRVFPVGRTIGLAILLLVQVVSVLFAVFYDPQPQDRIDLYELTVEPQADGTVALTYRFVWTALDASEDLTWIEIGLPNKHFDFHRDAFSENIASYEKYTDGDYVSARLYLDRPYRSGETLSFSFCIRQREMLCRDEEGYFYELVPGWFNATPVEHYRFIWKGTPAPVFVNTPDRAEGDPVWTGRMPCGTYVRMQVRYDAETFAGAHTAPYEEFSDRYVSDDLYGDKVGVVLLVIVVCVLALITQIYMVDCVVSYHRGRGFLTGYGHHVHIYGRSNHAYIRAKDQYDSHGRRSGGGGCACACACACAGGGRAGCSQKDTHPFPRPTDPSG